MPITASDLKSHAANLGGLDARQRREREQLADKHEKQHADLRARHERDQRKREEALKEQRAEKPPSGGRRDRFELRSDEDEARFRAEEHDKLDAKHRQERETLRERHVREQENARSGADDASPARLAGPSGPGALGAVLSGLSHQQRAEHATLVSKHEAARRELDERHSRGDRTASRYSHDRSKTHDLDLRTTEHRRLIEQQEREVEALRAKHERQNDAERRRRERQAAERRNLEDRHQRELEA